MGILGDIGNFIMTPLYYVISAVLVGFHEVFSLILDPASGAAWVLSIIFLTLTVRIMLIPLFVKQIKSSRNMQLMQPKVAELRKKYGHDRERLAQETMKLYKDSGTNPFASCLPLLLQMPIFLALFHLLNGAADSNPKGLLSQTEANQFGTAELFGARIAETFLSGGPGVTEVRVFAAILVVAMTATTFLTQRQLMSKNMPAEALTGQFAQQQKLLLYVLPLVFGIGGVAFPIGVLFYWTTSNLWTMGQQFYVIRNNPAPNTPAFTAKQDRDKAKAQRKGGVVVEPEPVVEPEQPKPVDRQRQQPKKQTRNQRKSKGNGNRPGGPQGPGGGTAGPSQEDS